MTSLRKIIDLINDNCVPIQYYDFDETKRLAHILYLKSISDEEQIAFNNLTIAAQKEYVSDTAKIYIPRLYVSRCAEIYRKSASYDFPYTLEKVKKIVQVGKNDEDTAFALYMILHEFGHWNDFVRLEKKPYAFSIPDSKQARKVWEYGNRIQDELNGKSVLTEKDKKKLKDFICRYYAIPVEQIANQYADEKYFHAYSVLKENEIVQ